VDLWTFSRQEKINSAYCVQAKNIHCSIHGISFEVIVYAQSPIPEGSRHLFSGDITHLTIKSKVKIVKSRLYGEFNVENLLAVLTTLLALGFDLETAVEKTSNLQSVCGRMEYFGGDELPTVFVDFAHTPDALEKVLQSLRHHNPKSLSVVFGCGGNRDAGKRSLMGAIAEKYADKVIITDDNPRFEEGGAIVSDILTGCEDKNITVIRDRALAIQTAISQAKTGDCVVIAGKGHENYQEIKGVKTPFSDQEIVKKALALWTE
jgi:UDP-N-acetylmuramoyl-L-alanyl-D-glutamate--2,6-diaminopimelate ligase